MNPFNPCFSIRTAEAFHKLWKILVSMLRIRCNAAQQRFQNPGVYLDHFIHIHSHDTLLRSSICIRSHLMCSHLFLITLNITQFPFSHAGSCNNSRRLSYAWYVTLIMVPKLSLLKWLQKFQCLRSER